MAYNDTLGVFLRFKRMSNGLTQIEMAQRLGITEQYYCQLENDKKVCGVELIKKIAEVTNVRTSCIFELREKTKSK